MTRTEFLQLPATRKGLRLLDAEFKRTNNIFFNEVSRMLKDRLNYRANRDNFFLNTLEKYEAIIKEGYRKELTLPF